MAREFSRRERVGDYLRRELAQLIQRELRDPRLGMVSITAVEVSRDIAHARVYVTLLDCDSEDEAKPSIEVLNRAGGFLRSSLAKDASMRTVPRLRFVFDSSIGRGRDLEALITRANQRSDSGDVSTGDTMGNSEYARDESGHGNNASTIDAGER